MKKDQTFSGVLPPNPHQRSAMNPLQSLKHLKTPTCVLQYSKTQSLFKKGQVLSKVLKILRDIYNYLEVYSEPCHVSKRELFAKVNW